MAILQVLRIRGCFPKRSQVSSKRCYAHIKSSQKMKDKVNLCRVTVVTASPLPWLKKKSQNGIGKSPSVTKSANRYQASKEANGETVGQLVSFLKELLRKKDFWMKHVCLLSTRAGCCEDVMFQRIQTNIKKKRAHTLSTSRNAITLLRPPQSWSLRNFKKGDPSLHDKLSKRWKQTKRKNFLKTKRTWKKKTILVKICV